MSNNEKKKDPKEVLYVISPRNESNHRSSPKISPCMENRKSTRLLDAIEVAEILGVSDKLVYKLKDNGEIPHVRVYGRIKFRPEDVEVFINKNLVGFKEDIHGWK